MISFSSRTTHQSVTQPGVTINLRRIGPRLRAEIEMSIAAEINRESDMVAEFSAADEQTRAMIEEIGVDEDGQPLIRQDPSLITPELKEQALKASTLYTTIINLRRARLWPAWVQAGLVSLEGIAIDDMPVTAQALAENGPDELYEEVFRLIHDGVYIDPNASKNSQSSTTGGTAAAGEMSGTTVATAESVGSTNPSSETASSTSLN